MTSETESNAPSVLTSACDLASEVANISIESERLQSQIEEFELPEHDDCSIYDDGKTYKRGKARPAKQRDRSLNTWYWEHGEGIFEDKKRRWMCEACWKIKKFIHYAETSNKAIVKHLKETHDITEHGHTNVI